MWQELFEMLRGWRIRIGSSQIDPSRWLQLGLRKFMSYDFIAEVWKFSKLTISNILGDRMILDSVGCGGGIYDSFVS